MLEYEEKLLDNIDYWDKSIFRKLPFFSGNKERLESLLKNFRRNRKESKMSLTDALVAESMSLEVCVAEVDVLGDDRSCAWLPVSTLLQSEFYREQEGINSFVLSPGASKSEQLTIRYNVKGSWLNLNDSMEYIREERIPKESRSH